MCRYVFRVFGYAGVDSAGSTSWGGVFLVEDEEQQEYSTGCKHCGNDTPLYGGSCADCLDPSEIPGLDWDGR